MAVSEVNAGGISLWISDLTGKAYKSQQEAESAESARAADPSLGMTDDQAQARASESGQTAHKNADGTYTFLDMTPAEKLAAATNPTTAPPAPTNPNTDPMATVNQVIAANKPQTPPPPVATRGTVQGATAPFNTTARVQRSQPSIWSGGVDTTGVDPNAVVNSGVIPGSTPQSGAPTADTSKVDTTVAGVNNTIAQLLAQANSPLYSVAEQQLLDSDRRNALAAQQALGQNQAAALGAARSGNRRDQGLLQRQAVGESQFLGTQAQQQQVAQQTAIEGNLATARAQEESQYNKDRAAMLEQAATLGLNVGALQTDISKANLGAATDYLNNQFQQLGIDKQLDQQQTANTLSFIQAMSAIQYDYDNMSNADKQHTLDLMSQQYSVDAQTAAAIEQARIAKQVNWGQVLAGAVGGAISGGAAIGAAAIKPAKA